MRDLSKRHSLRLVPQTSAVGDKRVRPRAREKSEAARMKALIRRRLLHALDAPPRVLALLTTVSDYMEALQSNSVPFGLELLAESLSHPGQPKFASRALDEKQRWESTLNIQTCNVRRGQRNVRRATEFFDNRLIDAADSIAKKLASDTRTLHTVTKIDEYCEAAIVQFLRKPLSAAKPKTTTAATRPVTKTQGGSVNSSDSVVPLSAGGELAVSLYRESFWPFPVDLDARRPRVTKWQQRHSEETIYAWDQRWPNTAWGITCGTRLADGRFLTVIDKDRHGETFGDGFKTLSMREHDLGPLPKTFTVTTPRNGEHLYFSSTTPLSSSHDLLGPGLDCKASGGFVVAPGSFGYQVTSNLPIAALPATWERALTVNQSTKKIAVGDRHDYLLATSYAMACQGKQRDEILRTLRIRREKNCEHTGRPITDQELEALADSAIAKIVRADEMLRRIVA